MFLKNSASKSESYEMWIAQISLGVLNTKYNTQKSARIYELKSIEHSF